MVKVFFICKALLCCSLIISAPGREVLILVPEAGKLSPPCPRQPPVPGRRSPHGCRGICLPLQPRQGRPAGINAHAALQKRRAAQLPALPRAAVIKGLLRVTLSLFFLWYLHFQLARSLPQKQPGRFQGEQFKRKCCFALKYFPLQLGRTAINTAHPPGIQIVGKVEAVDKILPLLKTALLLFCPQA